MKCPKCGYLGFEDVERCRNCGYEFLLASPAALHELPLRTDSEPIEALDDYSLTSIGSSTPSSALSAFGSELDPAAEPAGYPGASSPRAIEPQPAELPLFGAAVDDAPLITRPSPPRPPLAVRRATPDVTRARSQAPRAASFELSLEPDQRVPRIPRGDRVLAPERVDSDVRVRDAGVFSRMSAAIIDLVVLLAVDLAVVYLTMEICGVTLAEFGLVPKIPLVAFLVVQNVGYLVAFTAGGQTLGKMAAGIKVVAADSRQPVDVGCALKRTVAWLVLAFPAGLGFVTALFSRDHRGLHDRFAGTRVVRVSA